MFGVFSSVMPMKPTFDAVVLLDRVRREDRLAGVLVEHVRRRGTGTPRRGSVWSAQEFWLSLPSPSSRQPPFCIRRSSRQPSSNSWLPTLAICRPILFMASMVGSSWKAAESSGDRADQVTGGDRHESGRWPWPRAQLLEVGGQVLRAAGRGAVDPPRGRGRCRSLGSSWPWKSLIDEQLDRDAVLACTSSARAYLSLALVAGQDGERRGGCSAPNATLMRRRYWACRDMGLLGRVVGQDCGAREKPCRRPNPDNYFRRGAGPRALCEYYDGAEPSFEVVGPSSRRAHAVSALVEAATEADGVRPLSEHVMLHLRYGGDDPVRNVLALVRRRTCWPTGTSTSPIGWPAPAPSSSSTRRTAARGSAGALLGATLAETPDGRLRLWAHGGTRGGRARRCSMGFRQSRALWQLRRSAVRAPAAGRVAGRRRGPHLRAGPGRRGLAGGSTPSPSRDHPEQGSWTLDDLRPPSRAVVRPGRLLPGRRGDARSGSTGRRSHPAAWARSTWSASPRLRRAGSRPALTLRGLRHLQDLGLDAVLLDVDGTNAAAVSVYAPLGFTTAALDVQYGP